MQGAFLVYQNDMFVCLRVCKQANRRSLNKWHKVLSEVWISLGPMMRVIFEATNPLSLIGAERLIGKFN